PVTPYSSRVTGGLYLGEELDCALGQAGAEHDTRREGPGEVADRSRYRDRAASEVSPFHRVLPGPAVERQAGHHSLCRSAHLPARGPAPLARAVCSSAVRELAPDPLGRP